MIYYSMHKTITIGVVILGANAVVHLVDALLELLVVLVEVLDAAVEEARLDLGEAIISNDHAAKVKKKNHREMVCELLDVFAKCACHLCCWLLPWPLLYRDFLLVYFLTSLF